MACLKEMKLFYLKISNFIGFKHAITFFVKHIPIFYNFRKECADASVNPKNREICFHKSKAFKSHCNSLPSIMSQ